MEKDLISVIMPTFNVKDYIIDAVNSILTQTYSPIELVIVDDCSTDGTYELLKQFAARDSRIILCRNERNKKICKTLNRALELAHGEYIARMDGDDISRPERLQVLKEYLDIHPDIDLVGSQLISIDEKGKELSRKKYLRTASFIEIGNRFLSCVSHFWLARREIYRALYGYRDLPYAEDYDFLLRGSRLGFHYANSKEYLYSVRIRPGNTGSVNGLKQIKTKYYVQQLNKGKILYTPETYVSALQCSEKEQKKYSKAREHLDYAIRCRKKTFALIYHVLKGCFLSKYVLFYIVEVLILRVLLLVEMIIYSRTKW